MADVFCSMIICSQVTNVVAATAKRESIRGGGSEGSGCFRTSYTWRSLQWIKRCSGNQVGSLHQLKVLHLRVLWSKQPKRHWLGTFIHKQLNLCRPLPTKLVYAQYIINRKQKQSHVKTLPRCMWYVLEARLFIQGQISLCCILYYNRLSARHAADSFNCMLHSSCAS